MSRETDSSDHDCFRNADWEPDNTTPPNPVSGTCTVCGADVEHYCDNHVDVETGLTLLSHERHTDIPIYGIQDDCSVCGRELEVRFKKQGTFDRQTGTQVYGP